MKTNLISLIAAVAVLTSCHKKERTTTPLPVVNVPKAIVPDSTTIDSTKLPIVTVPQVPPYIDTFLGDVLEGESYPPQSNPKVATIHVYAYHDTHSQVVFSSEYFYSRFYGYSIDMMCTFTVDSSNYYPMVINQKFGDYFNFKLTGNKLIYNAGHSTGPDFDCIYFEGTKN